MPDTMPDRSAIAIKTAEMNIPALGDKTPDNGDDSKHEYDDYGLLAPGEIGFEQLVI